MSEQTIWTQLRKAGMSEAGAAGLMGNMQCESAMRSNNAQDGMTKLTDEAYTMAVDNGAYGNFVGDSVGYGLCQWTYHTRKAALLGFAHNWGVSIAAEDMQVAFAIAELQEGYAGLWAYLCSTDDVYTAASRVCKEFERPAVNNITARVKAAQEFYDRFTCAVSAPANEAEAAFSFAEAITYLKRGDRVKRKGWNGKNQYIELASNISYINAAGEVVNVQHEAIGSKAIAFTGTSGVQLGWLASQSDMLAEDWIFV